MLGVRPATLVGIDEAGRGAWLGPLVVGAVAVPRSGLAELARTGARDSKTLSPVRREEILERIVRCARVRTVAAPPELVDRHVARRELNRLEAALFGELARGFAPAEVRVDACDANARRFGEEVRRHAGGEVVVVSRHHADASDPLVGAASIVAKVERDRAIRALAGELGAELGSGYPSDARTIEFVARTVLPGDPRPAWLRASWATTRRVIGPAVARRGGTGP